MSGCEAFEAGELSRWSTPGHAMASAHASGAVLLSVASGAVRLTIHASPEEAEALADMIRGAVARVREMIGAPATENVDAD